jgi:hypothetical protein
MPLEIINEENFPKWMHIFQTIIDRPIPEVSIPYDIHVPYNLVLSHQSITGIDYQPVTVFHCLNVFISYFKAAMEQDEDERPRLAWWKAKKWSLHILQRIFERCVPNIIMITASRNIDTFAGFQIIFKEMLKFTGFLGMAHLFGRRLSKKKLLSIF